MMNLDEAKLDELERVARRDDWFKTIVGSDIRWLIALARQGLRLGSDEILCAGPVDAPPASKR